jgi:hypothetical protein
MEPISEQCWTSFEGIRHRVKSICRNADGDELASVDAEIVALRELVFNSLRAHEREARISS